MRSESNEGVTRVFDSVRYIYKDGGVDGVLQQGKARTEVNLDEVYAGSGNG